MGRRRKLNRQERAEAWRERHWRPKAMLVLNYLQNEYVRLRPLAEQHRLLDRERARGRLAVVRQLMKMLAVPPPERTVRLANPD